MNELCCALTYNALPFSRPAKYPCLQLRVSEGEEDPKAATELLFGSVAIGCHRKKPFTIHNTSPVSTRFWYSTAWHIDGAMHYNRNM